MWGLQGRRVQTSTVLPAFGKQPLAKPRDAGCFLGPRCHRFGFLLGKDPGDDINIRMLDLDSPVILGLRAGVYSILASMVMWPFGPLLGVTGCRGGRGAKGTCQGN